MTQIPLPKGIQGISSTPKRKEYLLNLFSHTSGYLLRAPGSSLVATAATTGCRGSSNWYVDQNAYFVIGEVLYQLDSSETLTAIGAIEGSADCDFSIGQVNLVIVVKGGKGYFYNATAGLQEIDDPDYVPSDSVDFIDGRHVFIPSDGSPAFYSEIDNPNNINPLSFFDAEELPDLNRVTINVSNNEYIGGNDSFEIYRSSGDVSAPFARREGARVDVGYASGIVRYKSSFMFIGRDRDQSYAVHLMGQGSTQVISNDSIGELLNTEYTKSEIESANSYSYTWKGVQIVGWNLPRHSIEFSGSGWAYRDSNLDSTTVGPWDGRSVVFAHGRYYIGNRTTGQIGKLVDDPAEYGNDVEYELQTFVRDMRSAYFSPSQLTLDLLTGQNATTIGLSVSDDGVRFSNFHYKTLYETGAYNRIVEWAGGLGQYESYMGIKLRGTGSVQLSIEGAEIS